MRAVGLKRDRQLQSPQGTGPAIQNLPPQKDLSLALPNEEFPVVIITGRAGTGKSTLVRELAKAGGPRQVVLAPTGVAALNVEGQTIHSFFRLPPHIVNPEELVPIPSRLQLYGNLDRIIIDEMSMVRADLLDAIDHSLRINRGTDVPFGGVKIVLIGDLLQLPPVVPTEEAEILANRGYETPYIVSAQALQRLRVRFVELPTVYRQDDEEFIQMLANLRVGENVEFVVNAINTRCFGPHRQTATPIILTATNAQADFHNHVKLLALPGQVFTYVGTLQGKFNLNQDRFPAPVQLKLKVGARVILVKNDSANRWVNGSLATVTQTRPNSVWVQLDGRPDECEINRVSWDKIEYRWSLGERRIVPEIVGSYSQIPLKTAWAITIHKAQGLTLENVRIDLGAGAFASGQAYVALSRVKSLAGLSLARRLTVADVWVDPTLLAVTEEIASRAEIWIDN
jgi:ATP-dependent exoDNAse (exonuclease V) alpha subunit